MKSIRIVAMATAVSIFALQASAQTPTQQPPSAKASSNTIIDIARGSKDNSTMLSAVKAAGMEETLTASLENDKIILTDAKGGKAKVATTDVKASNGVFHVIDSVLIPEAK